MSSKINVIEIIKGHFNTLRISEHGALDKTDIFTFYIVPILIAVIGIWNDFSLDNNLRAFLINFGSIFTALLLSVLVLVFDQETKLDDKNALLDQLNSQNGSSLTVPFFDIKKKILRELYHNIYYCIIGSMALVIVASIDSINISGITLSSWFEFDPNTEIFTAFCVFMSLNIVLTIFMIVKRMHALLTIQ